MTEGLMWDELGRRPGSLSPVSPTLEQEKGGFGAYKTPISGDALVTHRSHTQSASHRRPPQPWAGPAAPPTAWAPALPPASRGPVVHA